MTARAIQKSVILLTAEWLSEGFSDGFLSSQRNKFRAAALEPIALWSRSVVRRQGSTHWDWPQSKLRLHGARGPVLRPVLTTLTQATLRSITLGTTSHTHHA